MKTYKSTVILSAVLGFMAASLVFLSGGYFSGLGTGVFKLLSGWYQDPFYIASFLILWGIITWGILKLSE